MLKQVSYNVKAIIKNNFCTDIKIFSLGATNPILFYKITLFACSHANNPSAATPPIIILFPSAAAYIL